MPVSPGSGADAHTRSADRSERGGSLATAFVVFGGVPAAHPLRTDSNHHPHVRGILRGLVRVHLSRMTAAVIDRSNARPPIKQEKSHEKGHNHQVPPCHRR